MIKVRKHLTNSIKEFPVPKENERLVRVLEVRGSNQVLAEYPDKSPVLCLMPNKFKKVLWIAKGHYLIIKLAEVTSHSSGYQIKGVITHVLQDDAVRYLKKSKQFPEEFLDAVPETVQEEKKEGSGDEDEDDEEDEDTNENPNRVVFSESGSDEYTTDEDDEEGDNDDEEEEEIIEEIVDLKKPYFNHRKKINKK